jgi:hypothetical protein
VLKLKTTFVILAVFGWSLPWSGQAAELQWLSDTAPRTEGGKKSRHDHGGMVEEGEDGKVFKRLWLRSGSDVKKSEYLHGAPEDAVLVLMDPLGKATVLAPDALGHDGLRFALQDEGFYNVYLVERRVDDGVSTTTVTKAEVMKHSCRDGRHDWQAVSERIPPHTLDQAPFDIVRERMSGEDFHTEIRSGDEVSFRVLLAGKPAAGASVRMVTQHGWERTVTTNDKGVATFLVIRDYFPEWNDFQRRYREKYLVAAEYTVSQGGVAGGKAYRSARFRATLPGSYMPSKGDYTSYAYGFGLVLFASTFSGLGVYLYRRRRLKPYREVALNE